MHSYVAPCGFVAGTVAFYQRHRDQGVRSTTRRWRVAAVFAAMGFSLLASLAVSADVLVSNVGQGSGGVVVGGTSLDHAQGFTTGSSADGYTLTSVELGFRNATEVTAPTVTVHTGTPTGTTVATLTGPATVGTGLATFTAPDATTLAVNTDYYVRIEGGGAIMQIVNAYSTGEDANPSTGWTIHDEGYYRWAQATGAFERGGSVKQLRINGTNGPVTPVTPVVEDPPAGTVSIHSEYWQSGTGVWVKSEGLTVAEDRRFYDWYSVATDGTATQRDGYFGVWYSLHNADVGKQLVVEVSWFEDGERKRLRSQARPPGGVRARTASHIWNANFHSVTTTENTAHTFTLSELGSTILSGATGHSIAIHSLPTRGALTLDGTTVTKNQSISYADIRADKFVFTPATDETGPEHGVFTYEFSWSDSAQSMSVDVVAAATAMQLALDPPVVQGAPTISDAGDDGSWGPGETVEVTVSFDVSMFVDTTDGTPTIGIALGGTEARVAGYVRGHNTTDLVFSYTLTDADGSHDSMFVTADSLTLNDGSIRNAATGAAAELAHESAAKLAQPVLTQGALVLNVAAIATDNVINVAEKAAGFTISGDMGTEAGVSVVVKVGSHTFDAVTSAIASGETTATWSVSVPTAATYITGASVTVTVSASKTGFTAPSDVTRSLTVDLTAPTTPTYTAPGSLKVGTAITDMGPTGGTDIDAYSATGLPSGLTIDTTTGTINGTPDTANASTASVTITVSDTAGNTATVDVTMPAVAKGDQTLTGFEYSSGSITFGDTAPTLTAPTGAATTLSYAATPSTVCTVNATSGALTMLTVGSCEVTVTAAGTANWNEATATFTVTVVTSATDPFTGSFSNAPDGHDGSAAFTLRFDLSENPRGMSWRTVKDHLFDVTGGAIERAQRVQPTGSAKDRRWQLTVTPSGHDDVALTLRGTGACTDTHAVCTSDGRTLTGGTKVTVAGPVPVALTGTFEHVPLEHDGEAAFTIQFDLSENPGGMSWRTVKNHLFDVTGGAIARVQRVQSTGSAKNRRWQLTVTPSGHDDVTLTLRGTSACTDTHAVCTSDGRTLEGGTAVAVPGLAALSVADAAVREGASATLDFVVTLDRTRHAPVTVDWATRDGTAVAGQDYAAGTGTLTFAAGETRKTVSVAVTDDAHDDDGETMTFTLSNAVGARIADDEAIGTINNADRMPQAWLARFGRTASDHVLQAIEARLDATTSPASQLRLADRRIDGLAASGSRGSKHRFDPGFGSMSTRPWMKGRRTQSDGGSTSPGFIGSSFLYTPTLGENDAARGLPGRWEAWGQTAATRFSGVQGPLSLDGAVTTTTLGWDTAGARWFTGIALAYSEGEGAYTDAGSGRGRVSSELTQLAPFVRFELNARTRVWGTLGYGDGRLRLTPRHADAPIATELNNAMVALGARTTLAAHDHFGFALVSDARLTRTRSATVHNLMGATGETGRLRMLLQGTGAITLANGVALTPTVASGLRYDGGDAETGAGAELGAGLGLTLRGFTLQLNGRGLLAHATAAYAAWGVSGTARYDATADGRGLSLDMGSSWGVPHSGVPTLWDGKPGARAVQSANTAQRVSANVRYGIERQRSQILWTPYLGADTFNGRHGLRVGLNLSSSLRYEVGFELTRQLTVFDAPTHAIELRGIFRW